MNHSEEFLAYCQDQNIDPGDEYSQEEYKEMRDEIDNFWDNLDDDDREGYEHNMNR